MPWSPYHSGMADGLDEIEPDHDSSLPLAFDRDDDLPEPGLAVGYGGEDLDDVSPPVFHDGELPVGFEVDSPLPHLDLGHDVLHGDVGDDLDGLDFL
jgi:hypothetical protein